MYKIEIWRFHCVVDTYTRNNIKEILKWYKNNWQISYEWGDCSFEVYKNDKELSFYELEEIGFFEAFEDIEEEEE